MKGFVDAEVTFKMTFGDDDSQTILHGFIPCVKGSKIVLRKDCKTKKICSSSMSVLASPHAWV